MREEVSGGLDITRIGNTETPPRYAGRFNFKGTDRGKRVGELSGGERGRLHPGEAAAWAGGNVPLLDEPTNDRTSKPCARWKTPCWSSRLRDGYPHDRWFPDCIAATHIWTTTRDEGKAEFFEGNFTGIRRVQETHAGRRRAGAEAL